MEHRIVKTQFVADLKPGMTADTVFLCADVKTRITRNGSCFADVRLVDRTGEISLKLWRYSPDAALGLEPGACVRVGNVQVEEYGGSLQLSQDTSSFGRSITLCDVSQCNLADFVPATPRDVDEMTREVLDAVSGVSNKPVRCLLQPGSGSGPPRSGTITHTAAVFWSTLSTSCKYVDRRPISTIRSTGTFSVQGRFFTILERSKATITIGRGRRRPCRQMALRSIT